MFNLSILINNEGDIFITIGIYKITNKQTGQVYIGQSDNIERRLLEHKRKREIPIDMWINFLGKEAFDYEIIEECSIKDLGKKEKEYIEKFDSVKKGYNIQAGGINNFSGSGNGRAKLTEKDIIYIREAYANHKSPKEIYSSKYKNKISFSHFQAIWEGRSWSTIMPEVFTPENKKYYISEQMKTKALLTKNEVLEYRKYYITHTAEETFQKMLKDKGNLLKKETFIKILKGDVRKDSLYKNIPVYKKKLKKWILNNEPVSTIPETRE